MSDKRQVDIIENCHGYYNLTRSIRVFEANISVPFTLGFIHPKIFLPENTDHDNIDFILAHEMAHIKRHDFLMIMVQNFITMLFFFHPVVLIASGFLNYYRELICDDMAVEAIHSSPQNTVVKLSIIWNSVFARKNIQYWLMDLFFQKRSF